MLAAICPPTVSTISNNSSPTVMPSNRFVSNIVAKLFVFLYTLAALAFISPNFLASF